MYSTTKIVSVSCARAWWGRLDTICRIFYVIPDLSAIVDEQAVERRNDWFHLLKNELFNFRSGRHPDLPYWRKDRRRDESQVGEAYRGRDTTMTALCDTSYYQINEPKVDMWADRLACVRVLQRRRRTHKLCTFRENMSCTVTCVMHCSRMSHP